MSLRVEQIGLGDQRAWARALEGLPHGVAHTHAYNAALNQPIRLLSFDLGGGRAVCPIQLRSYEGHTDIFSPYGSGGFVGQGELDGLHAALEHLARDEGWVASYLIRHPTLGVDEPRETSHVSYIMPLKGDLLALMSPRRRAQVRKTTLDLVTDEALTIPAFLELYDQHLARVDASPVYHFGSSTLMRWCEHPQIHLLGARGAGGEIESVVMVAEGDCGEYLLMAANSSGKRWAAPLLYQGFLLLQRRGCPEVNLGGGIRGHDGVAEFKRRFGARPTPTFRCREIFDSERYDALCSRAGVGSADTAYFPAYHQRREEAA